MGNVTGFFYIICSFIQSWRRTTSCSYFLAMFVPLASPCLCPAIHLHELVRYVTLDFPLPVCPASVKFSKPFFLIICTINFNSLFMVLSFIFFFSLKLPRCSNVNKLWNKNLKAVFEFRLSSLRSLSHK